VSSGFDDARLPEGSRVKADSAPIIEIRGPFDRPHNSLTNATIPTAAITAR
jgi:hypothetical protein